MKMKMWWAVLCTALCFGYKIKVFHLRFMKSLNPKKRGRAEATTQAHFTPRHRNRRRKRKWRSKNDECLATLELLTFPSPLPLFPHSHFSFNKMATSGSTFLKTAGTAIIYKLGPCRRFGAIKRNETFAGVRCELGEGDEGRGQFPKCK